jgi:maleylacetate reductase
VSAAFTWDALPAHVVMARGAVSRISGEVDRLGLTRVLVIAGGRSTATALERIVSSLGTRAVGVVEDAAQHVPGRLATETVAEATRLGVDGVVTVGGGSATGLGKAVARGTGIALVAVPTTYAGSEMTPLWGQTDGGHKATGRDARALPRAVIYDPELCAGMPARLAAASGMNAMAHCVEAFWAEGANPVTTVLAEEGIRRLLRGLPSVVADPMDIDAHAENLVGACLAGTALAQAGTGIHHRTCHVLGGGWNLPHAETHAVVLPHATALVTPRAPAATSRIAALLSADDAATGLWDLLTQLGLPRSLTAIGMPAADLDVAVERVTAVAADDPLVAGEPAVRRMLAGALDGRFSRDA